MRALGLVLASVILAPPAAAQTPPQGEVGELLGGVTLADVHRLSTVDLAARVDRYAGTGFQLHSVNMHRIATSFVIVSAVSAAGRGVCGARQVRLDTQPIGAGEWRLDRNAMVAVPPPDWATAQLGIETRTERTIFHVLPGPARSIARTRAACAGVQIVGGFFAAADASAARRAAAILAAFRERVRRDPNSIETNCGGFTHCREQLAHLSVNDFDSFGECPELRISLGGVCVAFTPRPIETMGSYHHEMYRLELAGRGLRTRMLSYESHGMIID